jgi:hypothetical protein
MDQTIEWRNIHQFILSNLVKGNDNRNNHMTKLIKIKDCNGEQNVGIELENCDTYQTFLGKIKANFGNGLIKLINCGKLINASNFHTLEDGAVVLCLTGHPNDQSDNNELPVNKPPVNKPPVNKPPVNKPPVNKPPVNKPPVNKPPVNVNKPHSIVVDQTDGDKQEKYCYKQVKATLIVFLDFVKNNPQLKHMYADDYSQLITEITHNPILDQIILNILDQSGNIMEAMENGTEINLNIGGVGEPPKNEDTLSAIDQQTIEEIISIGFDPTQVVQTYIEMGKNKNDTVNKLLNQ